MKTSTFKMIAVFAAVSLLASVAVAKNGGNGNHSGFKISFGGSSAKQGLVYNGNNGNNCHNGHCNNNYRNCNSGYCNNYYNRYDNFGLGQAYEPFHSSYVVLPGDTFYTVSLKEYGTSANAKYIAQFNRMPQSTALTLNQTLMLPSISANGVLSLSRAPGAESLQGTTTPNSVANFSTTTSSTPAKTVAQAVTAPLPKVTVGSTLLVDGQTFGEKQGSARLRIGAAALKIDVVEWTTSSVKIRLPQLDLASASKADIEVVRADGTLASKTGVELNPPSEVALAR